MAKRYEIGDSEWERIENLFPKTKMEQPPKRDDRIMFNAILWLVRSGSAQDALYKLHFFGTKSIKPQIAITS